MGRGRELLARDEGDGAARDIGDLRILLEVRDADVGALLASSHDEYVLARLVVGSLQSLEYLGEVRLDV